jgi:hypothetical protein
VFSKEKTELLEAIVLELKNDQLTAASVHIQKCHQLWKFTRERKINHITFAHAVYAFICQFDLVLGLEYINN